jgi:hypothetical protein
MAIVGTVLILAGLGSWALYVGASGDEPHAYARNGSPPQYVQVYAGNTYRLAVRGGVPAVIAAGVEINSLTCTAAAPGQAPGALNISLEKTGSDPRKIEQSEPINDIASFVASRNERLHIECGGLGPVFVDDAEGAAFDWSGVWLTLASILLLIGIPLILSSFRSAGRGRSDSAAAHVGGLDPAAEEVL